MIAQEGNHARKIRSLLELVPTAVASVIVCAALVSTRANPALSSLGNSEPGLVAFARRQGGQALPMPFEHWTGDLDGMIKRQQIRALVVYSSTAFFYDQGRPEGISYEALQEFQRR